MDAFFTDLRVESRITKDLDAGLRRHGDLIRDSLCARELVTNRGQIES